jgi:hypothetical protein
MDLIITEEGAIALTNQFFMRCLFSSCLSKSPEPIEQGVRMSERISAAEEENYERLQDEIRTLSRKLFRLKLTYEFYKRMAPLSEVPAKREETISSLREEVFSSFKEEITQRAKTSQGVRIDRDQRHILKLEDSDCKNPENSLLQDLLKEKRKEIDRILSGLQAGVYEKNLPTFRARAAVTLSEYQSCFEEHNDLATRFELLRQSFS